MMTQQKTAHTVTKAYALMTMSTNYAFLRSPG